MPLPRREIVVPPWQRLSSGIIVPSSLSDRIATPAPITDLPAELQLPAAPLVLLDRRPSSEDQFVVRPSEGDLGIGRATTVEDLTEWLKEVPFEPAMIALCRLQAMFWPISTNGAAQLDVAREFFGEIPLIDRFQEFLVQHEKGVLFGEQEFFVVQRLLMDYARDGDLGDDLTEAEAQALKTAVLTARGIVDESQSYIDRETVSDQEILEYLVQNGAYHQRSNLLTSFARTYAIFVEGLEACQDEPWACPLEEWVGEDYPLTIAEQFAAGFGLQAVSKALSSDVPAGERSLVDLRQAFEPTALAGREEDIAAMLAAPRDWYRDQFAGASDLRSLVWKTTPFHQRPFIQFSDGRLGLLSPRVITSWTSEGFYYRLLVSASKRTTKRNNTVEAYTSNVGKLVERWALDLVRSVFGDRPVGGGRVHGEQPYGKGQFSPDIAIDLGTDLVLIEVRSGQLREETRVGGDIERFVDDIERVLLRKVRQLGARIADLLAETAQIPDVDVRIVERVWPIVVTGNITQTEALHDWVERELTAPYRDARVRGLVILDHEDLELLMGMLESHDLSIVEILRRWQEGPYAKLELARWANEDPGSPGVARSTYDEDRWERVTESLNDVLQLPVEKSTENTVGG